MWWNANTDAGLLKCVGLKRMPAEDADWSCRSASAKKRPAGSGEPGGESARPARRGRVPPCARGAGVCAVAGASARGRNRSGSALSGCAGERDPRVVCTSLEEALRRRRAGKGACGGSLLCEVATLTEYTSHALRPAAREPCRAPPLPRHYRTPESDSGAQQKDKQRAAGNSVVKKRFI